MCPPIDVAGLDVRIDASSAEKASQQLVAFGQQATGLTAALTGLEGQANLLSNRFATLSASANVAAQQHRSLTPAVAESSGALSHLGVTLTSVAASVAAYLSVREVVRTLEDVATGTIEWATQNQHLSRQLGITIQQASALTVTAREHNVSIDTVSHAWMALVMTLRTAPQTFGQLGFKFTIRMVLCCPSTRSCRTRLRALGSSRRVRIVPLRRPQSSIGRC